MTRPTLLLALAPLVFAPTSEAGSAPSPVAEIVTFRLVDGTDPAAFAEAAKAMTPFLRDTSAVLHRTLSRDATGLWTDHIVWTSMQAATTAAQEMIQRPEAQPFLGMIAPEDVQMRHAPVLFQME